MYKLRIIPQALKDIERLPQNVLKRIHEKIIALKENPRPADALKLIQEEGYPVRVGDYRILYRIQDKEKNIYIYRINHRKDAYK